MKTKGMINQCIRFKTDKDKENFKKTTFCSIIFTES